MLAIRWCGRLTPICVSWPGLCSRHSGLINWSQHFKHENPQFSETFRDIIGKISDYFDLDICEFNAEGSNLVRFEKYALLFTPATTTVFPRLAGGFLADSGIGGTHPSFLFF